MSDDRRAPARVIGIGASAGGVDALAKLMAALPPDLPHAVLVVLHLAPSGPSLLASILARKSALRVGTAEHGERLLPGHAYVAPPDRHLLVRDGRVVLSRAPRENSSRPSVDVMLRSIASEHGPAGVAVVLSGALGDGADGAVAVARAGGIVLVQDPADARVPSMPQRTIAAAGDRVHSVLTASGIGELLAGLPARDPVPHGGST
jgi:two-component system chemotaxis response regulator CheB